MKEMWKGVVGFENYYQVSNIGRVRSLDRTIIGKNNSTYKRKGRILKFKTDRDGYYALGLHSDGRIKHTTVHRLVAQAYIPNPENKNTVNHEDGDKTNNNVNNLSWMTMCENNQHAYRTGLKNNTGVHHPLSILSEKDVIMIRLLYKTGIYSQRALSRIFKTSKSNISLIVLRQTWSRLY